MLFWKYPELKNKNYNYLYFKYCLKFHYKEIGNNDKTPFSTFLNQYLNPEFWEKMPAMESISRCKRKLAKNDELFRPDKKEVIESRLNQTQNILEQCEKEWPYE